MPKFSYIVPLLSLLLGCSAEKGVCDSTALVQTALGQHRQGSGRPRRHCEEEVLEYGLAGRSAQLFVDDCKAQHGVHGHIRHQHAIRRRRLASMLGAAAPDLPITPFSRDTGSAMDLRWMAYHKKLAQLANKDRLTNLDVLFVGDSITENLNGSGIGREQKGATRPQAFQSVFGNWTTRNLGVNGDFVQHVLWRLGAGKELGHYHPQAVNLLIGINNLKSGSSPNLTVEGIKQIASLLKDKLPDATVFVNKILPASKTLEAKIRQTNDLLNHDMPSGVHVIDCGSALTITKTWASAVYNPALYTDSLHPNVQGTLVWLECIKRHMKQLVTSFS